MSGQSQSSKKRMTAAQIKHYTGKRVSSVKWIIPEGYAQCEITGKMLPESELEISFPHYLFDRNVLSANRIYCEDAAWLSQEGYDIILTALEKIGIDYQAVIEEWLMS